MKEGMERNELLDFGVKDDLCIWWRAGFVDDTEVWYIGSTKLVIIVKD